MRMTLKRQEVEGEVLGFTRGGKEGRGRRSKEDERKVLVDESQRSVLEFTGEDLGERKKKERVGEYEKASGEVEVER